MHKSQRQCAWWLLSTPDSYGWRLLSWATKLDTLHFSTKKQQFSLLLHPLITMLGVQKVKFLTNPLQVDDMKKVYMVWSSTCISVNGNYWIIHNIYTSKKGEKKGNIPSRFGQDCTLCTLLNWNLSLPHLAQGALQSHDLAADLVEMNLRKCHREMYNHERVTNERKIKSYMYLIPFCNKFKHQNLSGGSCLFKLNDL